ncbi:MFS transporter [Paraburkholderia sediminicola]|nr:MFS transporter [Paraburkholderia sediminicola]
MSFPSSSRETSKIKNDRFVEFRRGWRAVMLGFCGVAVAPLPVFLYIFGALVQPLQQNFGWSRPELQISISFAFAGLITGTQLVGWMNRRWKMRNVTVCSLVALSVTWVVMPFMLRTVASFYAFAFLLTFVGLGAMHITWSNLVILWFERSRGMALSMILCGSGLAAAIFPLIVTLAVGRWGWQSAFWLMAVLPAGVVLPMTLFWLKTPGEQDQGRAGEAQVLARGGVTFSDGIRSPKFWLLAIALSTVVACVLSMMSFCIPLLRDKGFSAGDASRIFGVAGVALIVGRIIVGYLIDWLWAPAIGAVVFLCPAVAAVVLVNLSIPSPTVAVIALALLGFGTGAELDLGAYLVARYFGTREYGRLFGVHLGVNTLASMIAPFFISRLYGATASYSSTLLVVAVCLVAASIGVLCLGRYPDKFESETVYGDPKTAD